MAQRDPFYAVKDKVQQSLSDLRALLSRADDLLSTPAGASSGEVETLLASARTEMSQIHVDVKDLAQTITIVEENRSRFPSIDNRELDSRRGFVNDAKTTLNQADEQIKATAYKLQMANNKRKQLLADTSSSSSRFLPSASDSMHGSNDDIVAGARTQQLTIERQQDLVMDDMSHALDRLQGIGQTINEQLRESEAHLGELDEELDTAQSTMDTVLKKMDKLLKSSDKGRLCLILILFITAIGLFLGIIYG